MAHSDDSVSLSLFLFLSFFLSFFGEYYPLSQSCRDDIRTDTCACGAPGPRKPVHMEKKEGGGGEVCIKDSSQMSLIHYCIVKEML